MIDKTRTQRRALLVFAMFIGACAMTHQDKIQDKIPPHRLFAIDKGFKVPDGTIVYPFLNSKDLESGLPWELNDGFSIAAGDIGPNQKSKIHLMPITSQVTFVLEGQLKIRMKEPDGAAPYTVTARQHQAVLTKPFVFMQLINDTQEECRVLYLVSPPYLFSKDKSGEIEYDDAISFDEDWSDLEEAGWRPASLPSPQQAAERRAAVYDRISRQEKRGR